MLSFYHCNDKSLFFSLIDTAGINPSISLIPRHVKLIVSFKIFYSMFSSRPMQSLSKMRTIQFTTIQFGPVRSPVSRYFLQRKFFPSFFEEIRFRTWRIRIVFTFFFFFFCAKGLALASPQTSFGVRLSRIHSVGEK